MGRLPQQQGDIYAGKYDLLKKILLVREREIGEQRLEAALQSEIQSLSQKLQNSLNENDALKLKLSNLEAELCLAREKGSATLALEAEKSA